MSSITYCLRGHSLPAVKAEAKLRNGDAVRALAEALTTETQLIVKFDGHDELPNHHRELIAIAHNIGGVEVLVTTNGELDCILEELRSELRNRNRALESRPAV